MSMQAIPIARIKNFLAKPTASDTDPENFQSWGERVEKSVQSKSISNPICWPDPDSITGISEHQRSQISLSMSDNVGLFSGGPGTGKTHTISHLIKAVLRQFPFAQIRLMAPTGKAAQRMSGAMQEAGLPQLRGSTIHTALVPTRNGHDRNGWGFHHNETNPLYAHLVVVDEASMLDCSLMASLLAAIGPGTLVLFVGDPNQLPPVGKGRPFADMIEAGLPHGHLTEIHRFAGRIAKVCKQIVEGERWEPSSKLDLESVPPENMRHVEVSKVTGQVEAVSDLLQRIGKRGFNLLNDVQILCATNDTRERLNVAMQKLLNPGGEACEGNAYRLGDKAICLRNQWVDHDWNEPKKPKNVQQSYVANGEIGEVVRIDKAFTVIKFDEGRILRFHKALWTDIALAYVITIWKAQGSQYPVIITVAEDTRGADMICDASAWYTAISRAGKLSITLGKRSCIDRQCSRRGLHYRKTLLVEKLRANLSVNNDFSDI